VRPTVKRIAEPASLEARDVVKAYGGLRAVDGVSLTARPGEILGIAGSNGAGKTTLFDVISGRVPATAGDVLLGGTSIAGRSVHDRCRDGLARTFQSPTVAGTLTVGENVRLSRRHGSRAREVRDDASRDAAVLAFVGLDGAADAPAEGLGVHDKKRLMLATALAADPRVLLLDEPFGGLRPEEIDATLDLVRAIADLGVTVICIEHVMRALTRLAERVLVMHRGKAFFEGTPREMLADREVIEVYLGQGVSARGGGADG
jgi:branched-chain amino acid transport system ATP-binding protein